jgi:hypothetical protein
MKQRTSKSILTGVLLPALLLAGCQPSGDSALTDPVASVGTAPPRATFSVVGKLQSSRLDEASGLQVGDGTLYLHNDDGRRLFVASPNGRELGEVKLDQAKNRDWEDITRVPGDDGPLLVVGDIGDNHAGRKDVSLYFLREADLVSPWQDVAARHRLRVRYPDGARDAEALAYDPDERLLLILSKRDQPPRLYGIPLDLALWQDEVEAEFLGEVPGFRPPTRSDILRHPGRGLWVSQPTGMDISPDGRLAAVITYRSLYLFRREPGESWADAMQRPPEEYIGPPGYHDEAVGFSPDGRSIYVTTEGRPAPLYRLDLP